MEAPQITDAKMTNLHISTRSGCVAPANLRAVPVSLRSVKKGAKVSANGTMADTRGKGANTHGEFRRVDLAMGTIKYGLHTGICTLLLASTSP